MKGAKPHTEFPADLTAEWLERLLRNDEAAWYSLVREYSGLLLALAARTFSAYNYKASMHDAEDVVAAVWRNLLDHDKRLIRRSLAKGFFLQTVHVLVRHRAIDRMRARTWTTVSDVEDLPAGETDAALARELPPGRMDAAMKTLNLRERTIVNLFFLQERSYREIVELTGIPQNSIGPTLSRALAKLREALREEDLGG